MSKIKQVIVIRKDLKMRRGKEIAQACHASMAFLIRKLVTEVLEQRYFSITDATAEWLETGTAKVTLQVDSEEALLEIYNKAQKAGLQVNLVVDKGLTEFHGVPTKTCLAIGPDYGDKIDKITGHLKLY